MRQQKKLKEEEELYFVLLDYLRSPEAMKSITGGSLKTAKTQEQM